MDQFSIVFNTQFLTPSNPAKTPTDNVSKTEESVVSLREHVSDLSYNPAMHALIILIATADILGFPLEKIAMTYREFFSDYERIIIGDADVTISVHIFDFCVRKTLFGYFKFDDEEPHPDSNFLSKLRRQDRDDPDFLVLPACFDEPIEWAFANAECDKIRFMAIHTENARKQIFISSFKGANLDVNLYQLYRDLTDSMPNFHLSMPTIGSAHHILFYNDDKMNFVVQYPPLPLTWQQAMAFLEKHNPDAMQRHVRENNREDNREEGDAKRAKC
jgi:hypothetical protein